MVDSWNVATTIAEAAPRVETQGASTDDFGTKRRFCCSKRAASKWTLSSTTALCASFLALLIGLGLLVTSIVTKEDAVLDPTPTWGPTQNATLDYWMQLRQQFVNDTVLIPDSPSWKALQWMTLHDPLAPLDNSERRAQRYALTVLYFAWAGRSTWSLVSGNGWMHDYGSGPNASIHECDWVGVACNGDNQVTTLQLGGQEESAFSLFGKVPSELALLTNLERLVLSENELRGGLHDSIYTQLTNLRHVDLSQNQMTLVSPKIRHWKRLETLNWRTNLLQSTVPTELGLLTNLRSVELGNNLNLNGDVWGMIPNWPKLEVVDTSYSNISGTLPTQVGLLTNLRMLVASYSAFYGNFPAEISQCTQLRHLLCGVPTTLGGFTGSFPTTIGNLVNLVSITMSWNDLTGTLPTELGRLTLLHSLVLEGNRDLRGTLPTELGYLTDLQILRLSRSSLTGTVPAELSGATSLFEVSLEESNLSGTVPTAVCELPNLGTFDAGCSRSNATTSKIKCGCCFCFNL